MEDKLEAAGGDTSRHIEPISDISQKLVNTDVRDLAHQIVTSIVDTSNDPLAAVAALKRIQSAVELVFKDDDLKDHLMTEYRKWGDKPLIRNNVLIAEGATYTEYDYIISGHLEYNALSQIMDTCKARMKSIENDLRNLKVPIDMGFRFIPELKSVEYDEVATVYPPTKRQKRGFKFTIQ